MERAKRTPLRSEVAMEETWDLTDLFRTEADWREELTVIRREVKTVTRFKGKVCESAKNLLDALLAKDALLERLNRAAIYAFLNQAADGTDPVFQANASLADSLSSDVHAAISFIDSEIMEADAETLNRYMEEEKGLQEFRKVLADLMEKKPHKLHPEAEEALAAFGEIHNAPYAIYQRSKTSDMRFSPFRTKDGTEHPLTFNSFPKYEESADTELRRKAYRAFVEGLNRYKNTYAAAYATEVKKHVIEAALRKYASATDMLLAGQQVTKEMYHGLLDTILAELSPHMRRYAKLKKRVLGLDKFYYCDLKASLDPEYDPQISYEEAAELILEALRVMGPEYAEIIEQGLYNRWVDRADNIGKRSGAFCSSPYGVHPYILMTWNGSMRNAFTLAHELGHAAHFVLAARNQKFSNTRPSRYFVEAPSTLNERLLSRHILARTKNARMRRWVILQSLSTYYHNFVTHLLEAEFQRRIYDLADKGTPITAKLLCEQFIDLLEKFWGDAVIIDEGAGLTWMQQPHYYMGLYPYTYSAGLTASTAVAQMIEKEGKPAVERWLAALKAGGTLKPLELMQLAGVDMSTAKPIRQAVAYVGAMIDELEKSF
ncbi:MAG: oligoendopeptidase F [Caldibacillus debilis]|uniref:oligoendopeptidase F n=1 Tax=Caldibacillus debilis TaxID=301148 RepID=UPI000E37EB68|nr:oligoendopeptidase F [Caldibacillus debilis]REJ14968.1 MAG: oligoendopeptidase F [Caldibacillus debilis]